MDYKQLYEQTKQYLEMEREVCELVRKDKSDWVDKYNVEINKRIEIQNKYEIFKERYLSGTDRISKHLGTIRTQKFTIDALKEENEQLKKDLKEKTEMNAEWMFDWEGQMKHACDMEIENKKLKQENRRLRGIIDKSDIFALPKDSDEESDEEKGNLFDSDEEVIISESESEEEWMDDCLKDTAVVLPPPKGLGRCHWVKCIAQCRYDEGERHCKTHQKEYVPERQYAPKCEDCPHNGVCAPKLMKDGSKSSEWGNTNDGGKHPYHWAVCDKCFAEDNEE